MLRDMGPTRFHLPLLYQSGQPNISPSSNLYSTEMRAVMSACAIMTCSNFFVVPMTNIWALHESHQDLIGSDMGLKGFHCPSRKNKQLVICVDLNSHIAFGWLWVSDKTSFISYTCFTTNFHSQMKPPRVLNLLEAWDVLF